MENIKFKSVEPEKEKQTVRIQIIGESATGKSTLALAIIDVLEKHGHDVNLINSMDYRNLEHMKNALTHDITLDQRLDILKSKIKIDVEEVYSVRRF